MIEVLILGSYHFMEEVKIDNFSIETQNEIENLIANLMRFKPTKVFIEAPMEEQEAIDKAYNSLEKEIFSDRVKMRDINIGEISIAGNKYPIHMNNEAIQIGFRLAKYMNHEKVFSIDYLDFYSYENQLLKQFKHQFTSDYEKNEQCKKELVDDENKSSFIEKINYLNSDEWSYRMHKYYYEDVKDVGKGTNKIGFKKMEHWHSRNIKIVSNLEKYLDKHDRAVIVYGAGHIKPFVELLSNRSNLKVIRYETYMNNSIV